MDPLTALLVLTLLGILLRQHAVVQAQRLRGPVATSSVQVPEPARRNDAPARTGVATDPEVPQESAVSANVKEGSSPCPA